MSHNFKKGGSYYRLFFDDICIVIGLQKSRYSNGYYINLGYIITSAVDDNCKLRYMDGHVRARFSNKESNQVSFFDLDTVNPESLRKCVVMNLEKYIIPVKSVSDLKVLILDNPVMLYQTTLVAKAIMKLK